MGKRNPARSIVCHLPEKAPSYSAGHCYARNFSQSKCQWGKKKLRCIFYRTLFISLLFWSRVVFISSSRGFHFYVGVKTPVPAEFIILCLNKATKSKETIQTRTFSVFSICRSDFQNLWPAWIFFISMETLKNILGTCTCPRMNEHSGNVSFFELSGRMFFSMAVRKATAW